MARARIQVNGVDGSNFDLPINTAVNLANNGEGGEATFSWSILSQPPGAVDPLAGASTAAPSFTPRKEGSYVVQLQVNGGGGVLTDTQVAAIRFLKTRARAPGAQETNQQDPVHGWETERFLADQRIDNLVASEYGIVVGQASATGLNRGKVVYISGTAIIKNTLPGQESLPAFSSAPGTSSLGALHSVLGVVEGGVDGSTTPATGALIRVRLMGRFAGAVVTGPVAIGDPLFVDDTGALVSETFGTHRRQLATAISASAGAGNVDIWVDGSPFPMEDKQLIGITTGLGVAPGTRSLDLGALTATFALKSASDVVMPASVQRNSAASTADLFDALDQTGAVLSGLDRNGSLIMRQAAPQAITKTGGVLRIGTDDANALIWKTNAVDRWSLDANTGDLTGVLAATQQILKSGGLLRIGTTDANQLALRTDGVDRWTIDAVNGDLTAAVVAVQQILKSGGSLRIGTTDANAILLRAAGVDVWQILATGVLAAVGGNRAIQNVLNPVNPQDASNKTYTDAQDTATLTSASTYADAGDTTESTARTSADNALQASINAKIGVVAAAVVRVLASWGSGYPANPTIAPGSFGPITGATHVGQGQNDVAVTGLTANGIVTATAVTLNTNTSYAASVIVSAGSVRVWVTSGGATGQDVDFHIVVYKL